ncbi:VRR-NUC domain-containing protein [Glaciimonas immobilis]|uniref:phosphodiesterase I n=1 Tax=Glaciimonas immobilis TaxID=728004 RepID=A0A840RUA6_9BURK|nr:VRR-NUC domain-containing protein [Glaciimonas immobilis]KAF3996324.1 VRR-NUC domain-containing protein [Glaciimonas immobilis]MBB5202157.1 hypothetical protein [Glaciimonas immobilis]
MMKSLENRFYYLDNFCIAINWVRERYDDLLTKEERGFIDFFPLLPQPSRALLVRMLMRKGDYFRSGKLCYDEIGEVQAAAAPLIALGWVNDAPALHLDTLFSLLKKTEVSHIFGALLRKNAAYAAKKADQLLALRNEFSDGPDARADVARGVATADGADGADVAVGANADVDAPVNVATDDNAESETRAFLSWYPDASDCVYQVCVSALCDRLRLLFFGNLRQDWTEFVLVDLGLFTYEKVAFSLASRGFQHRQDIDDYYYLYQCGQRFHQGESAETVLIDIPTESYDSILLEGRRNRLLFQIAEHYEQAKDYAAALNLYGRITYPGSRVRTIRTMERCGHFSAAFSLAKIAENQPESEAEKQHLLRIFPRLNRQLGYPKAPVIEKRSVDRIDLMLLRPAEPKSVEECARDHIEALAPEQGARVHYVENGLINSLFGLLCWNAIFAPIPNAFYHPFHTGPVDLYSPDFFQRRAAQFGESLQQLDSDQYISTIRQSFKDKYGIQSPFVFWELMSKELLEVALACLPAYHLKRWFERMLEDIKSNRAGMPDLIQFWPAEKKYRMIEVKGPGDRLQDNQLRWLDYCARNDMPVAVCYVQWAD